MAKLNLEREIIAKAAIEALTGVAPDARKFATCALHTHMRNFVQGIQLFLVCGLCVLLRTYTAVAAWCPGSCYCVQPSATWRASDHVCRLCAAEGEIGQ